MEQNKIKEVERLANYVSGYADSIQNQTLAKAADWLEKLARNMCGGGCIGCDGGPDCGSDHK